MVIDQLHKSVEDVDMICQNSQLGDWLDIVMMNNESILVWYALLVRVSRFAIVNNQLTLSLAFLDCGLLSFCSVEEKSELEALIEEQESEILKGEASREVLSEESSTCGQMGCPALPKRNVHDC